MPRRLNPKQRPLDSGFGPKSEPAEVLAGVDLSGRTAVVTGGYSGIGLETTRALAAAGASVVVPVRDPAKAADALTGLAGSVATVGLDLGDLDSVAACADAVLEDHPVIDLLINNAGIMACPERRVGRDWESQFAVNHLGHFALTRALIPALGRAESPRVVSLSSIAHRRGGIEWDDIHFRSRPYDKWAAYAQAKSANALFALGLSRRLADVGGRAFSVHPGGIFTPLQRSLPVDEQVQLGWLNPDGTPSEVAQALFKTPSQGCSTTLWAATSPMLADVHGVYCEDGDVAAVATEDSPRWAHVAEHAIDIDDAERLWDRTEAMLAVG